MAEEETTIIRKITLGHAYSTIDDVIRLLRDLTPTEKIQLTLLFTDRDGFRFSETVELRELIIRKKSNIHHLKVYDCFEFFVQFLLANNGETKHFLCLDTTIIPMQLDQATRLSNAIRSNDSNGNIESFVFFGFSESNDVFQPVWDALLTTNVQNIKLLLKSSKNNVFNGGNNIDFSNISTNKSLKILQVGITLCETNLFDSIKGNKTVEKLIVEPQLGDAMFYNRDKEAFIEMLFENTTLIHVELRDGNYNHILLEEINIHTTLNQIWKRLIIVKRKERIAAATATAAISTTTTTTSVAITAIDDDAIERMEQDNNISEVEKIKKMEEEKKIIKKKKEMNLWLKTFEKKPVICNELIYLFLTENADMYNSNVTSEIDDRVERKRKRQK